MILIAEVTLVLILLGFAVAEIFFPIGIVVVLSLIGAWWFGHLALLWALLNPFWIGIYFTVGIAWVFFKWTRYIEHRFKEAREIQKRKPDYQFDIPSWSSHWDEYISHFFWWPFSVAAYILSDLLTNVWEWISKMVTKSFDAYAKWRFKSLK